MPDTQSEQRALGLWMVARKLRQQSGRKTCRWAIYNMGGLLLGHVEWYGTWRQYVYNPHVAEGADLVLAASCLHDLETFVAALNAEQRRVVATRRAEAAR